MPLLLTRQALLLSGNVHQLLGSFVGPSLIGALSDSSSFGGGSYTAAVLVLAAFLLAASAMQLLFREPGARARLGVTG